MLVNNIAIFLKKKKTTKRQYAGEQCRKFPDIVKQRLVEDTKK